MSAVDNGIYDRPYLSQDLTDSALLMYMDISHLQDLLWRLWAPPSELVYVIASVLRRTTLIRDSLIVKMPPPMGTGQSGPSYV